MGYKYAILGRGMAFTKEKLDLIDSINRLKREKKALILVHNYQRPEIYEVADFIGDSLGLCIEAAKVKDAELIVFCGVNFMAESAAVLNPGKRVITPVPDAGCALSDMVDRPGLLAEKKKYPDAAVVCYVNSSAVVKAESDICCTSSNAVQVVRSVPNKQVLFIPDKNLAAFVAREVTDKEIIAWDGYCPIHKRITARYLEDILQQYPDAELIVHPECLPEVIDMADAVCSTSGMIDYAHKSPAREFVVITECGMVSRLRREVPDKLFHTSCSVCFDMKKNTLETIYDALAKPNGGYEVKIEPEIAARAVRALMNMIAVTTASQLTGDLSVPGRNLIAQDEG